MADHFHYPFRKVMMVKPSKVQQEKRAETLFSFLMPRLKPE